MMSVLAVGEDTVLEIAEYLDAVSLCRFLSTTKQLWKLMTNDRFSKRIIPFKDFVEDENWTY